MTCAEKGQRQSKLLDAGLPFYMTRHPLLFFALPARRLGLTVMLCELQILPVGADKMIALTDRPDSLVKNRLEVLLRQSRAFEVLSGVMH